jgi:hypothetical protein
MLIGKRNALTLVELLIALSLIAAVSLGLVSVNLFSAEHFFNAQRRAQVENELSFVLEHMSKALIGREGRGGAIGEVDNPAIIANNALIPYEGGGGQDPGIIIYIDKNGNGVRDAVGVAGGDAVIAYRYQPEGKPDGWQMWFYPDYYNYPAVSRNPAVLSGRIKNFMIIQNPPGNAYSPVQNYVEFEISACWEPAQSPGSCGSPANPMATVRVRFQAPSISTN